MLYDTLMPRKLTDEQRVAAFWNKVEKTATCWLWRGHIGRLGYGVFSMYRKLAKAHRVSYEWAKGPIGEGLEIDHLCRVRHCVNPEHLEAVTHSTNMRRSLSPPGFHAAKTHCLRGHPFDETNTYLGSKGERFCRKCGIARSIAWQKRQALKLKASN